MKKIIFNSVAVVFIFSFILVGCKKDEKKEEEKKVEQNGLTKEINQRIPDSIINIMVNMGMPIHRGGSPANITGTYMARPFILRASNVPNDRVGMQFYDYKVTFHTQDSDKLTVKLDYVNGSETATGMSSYIVGTDNAFSVFSEVKTSYLGDSAAVVIVISGKLMDDGVHDLYFSNFMINNYGNPNNTMLANGQGRVIYDSDSLSEKVTKAMPFNDETFNRLVVSSVKKE